MASLIVRVVKSPGLIADGIAFYMDSLWDHVEFGTPEETWLGAHAGSGVQERFAAYMIPVRERRYALPVTDAQLAQVMSWGRSKIGTPYNYEDIVGLFLHDRSMSLEPNGREICSMFVTEGLLSVFPDDLLNVVPQYTPLITPETLHLSPIFRGRCIYSAGA